MVEEDPPEYISSKHDLETIELKWGQGAKCIGGEIKVDSIERANELKKRSAYSMVELAMAIKYCSEAKIDLLTLRWQAVSESGTRPQEIFVCYEELAQRFGDDMKHLPLGALGIYTYTQKFRTGLQQLMAGSRRFNISKINRNDCMALTEEASKISGIPYVMNAYRETAEAILDE